MTAAPGPADRTAVSPDELSRRTRPAGTDQSSERRLRCLVTNDDGIDSEGLRRLALVAIEAGLDVVVAAPVHDSSGASASITAAGTDGRFAVEPRTLPDLTDRPVHAVGALPAFIALTGCRGAFGPTPDLVLSGINRGPNTGQAVLHSGTVGAALTAATQGVRAMAVSLAVGADPAWHTAAEYTRRVLPGLLAAPAGVVLNLNVPNLPPEQVRGLRRAPLAGFGAVEFSVVDAGEGWTTMGVSEIDFSTEPDSDAGLLAAGWATLTALRPVCPDLAVDIRGVTFASAPSGEFP
ncbi:MAG TPA: 5'/3'-nucleotidase SurE [Sporichthyaceae bacterium]|nr:5'/3'-nucleotidase SurE [Sporichthyaceae bacterium]